MSTQEDRTAWRAALRAQAADVVRLPHLRCAGRAEELFGQLNEEVLSLRIALAEQRDGLLNEAELIAKLEVCGEFGR